MYKRFLIGTAGLLALSSTVSANEISLFETQFDTDFIAAGVGGLRGTGFGDISLAGVSGTVTQAYLYWHGPTSSSDPAFNANISLNGTAISGVNIGFSDDNFWGQDNSQAYRADVTSLVSGDGTYSLTGLSPANSNGATLAVFFDDGDATNNRDIVIFDGNDANFDNAFDPLGWDVTLSGIDYSSGLASVLFGVSDGQDFGAFDDGTFAINGSPLFAAGDVFEGLTVPETAGTSIGNGALWDLVNVDITSFLTPGLNDLNITASPFNDALSAIHFMVDLPAGAAPPEPPTTGVPEPATIGLFGFGLVAMGLARRRRRQV